MYGGGSIGRGFLGQLFNMSGYTTCFIDVDKKLIKKLSEKKQYTIKIATPKGYEKQIINNITAVDGMDAVAVSEWISTCDIMATAVGVNILPLIAKILAKGLDDRFDNGANPLDILVCENMSNGGRYLKNLVMTHSKYPDFINSSIGFVSASVGRMVPVSDSSDIIVEGYNELPIDKDALHTDISELVNFIPVSPFAIEKYKKYFMHNMSHAIVAYLGYIKGYEYIWQAMADHEIYEIAKNALSESILAISIHFKVSRDILDVYALDLLERYTNRFLGDTVLRVGRDPVRKLGKDDRLAGALSFCRKNNVEPKFIQYGIASALYFNPEYDISSRELQKYIAKKGIKDTLNHFSCITYNSIDSEKIIEIYKHLKSL